VIDALAAGGAAILFGVYADLAYNTYSATNSSPQTTELFAGERSDTLWKYVKLGGLQVLALGAFGALLAGQMWMWPLLGVASVMIAMHLMYSHALKAGTSNLEQG
jgi:hypothetical protein